MAKANRLMLSILALTAISLSQDVRASVLEPSANETSTTDSRLTTETTKSVETPKMQLAIEKSDLKDKSEPSASSLPNAEASKKTNEKPLAVDSSLPAVENQATSNKTSQTSAGEQSKETETLHKDGFRLLKLHEYAKALEAFNQSAREHPDSAEPHFGRAKALFGLGRRAEAMKELKVCLLLDPSGAMSEKCKKEIDRATSRPPDLSNPQTITSSDVEKSATKITNQAADQIRLIQKQASSRLTSSPFRSNSDYTVSTPYSPPYSRFSPRSSRHKSSRREDDYRARAAAEDARLRSQAIRDAAMGLSTAMATKPSESSGVYLTPHNTNLFVRNYVTFDPVRPVPPQELTATQHRLEEVHSKTKGRTQTIIKPKSNPPPFSRAPQLDRTRAKAK
jgi:tetratricopeptide (TPR) repeat protein